MYLKAGYLCLCLLLCFTCTHAQDIVIRNASLEGMPAQYRAPSQWIVTSSTPDIQPGITGVTFPPSHGNSYVGFRGGRNWLEAICQLLTTPMKAGNRYTISFDLSFARGYDTATCYGALAIYGGHKVNDTLELLWQSGPFDHMEWKRYTAEFTPKGTYEYIVFGGDVRDACETADGIALGIDHLSDSLKEVPVVTLDIQHTCPNSNNGAIKVLATGATQPYRYEWLPGGSTADNISGLAPGNYSVTVYAANNASVKRDITITTTDLSATAEVVTPGCFGDNSNSIIMQPSGGSSPYTYFINGEKEGRMQPEIGNLYAGTYNIIMQDAHGCEYKMPAIEISDPPALILNGLEVKKMSCIGANDAALIFTVKGGTPPYTYSIPGSVRQQDSTIRQLAAGTYNYQVTDSHDCYITGAEPVPESDARCAVYVPTAFSPDGNGQNDVFRVKMYDVVNNFRMSIYNRWGQLVYQSTDPKQGWNGERKGIRLDPGTYLWTITYEDHAHQPMQQQGSILLIR